MCTGQLIQRKISSEGEFVCGGWNYMGTILQNKSVCVWERESITHNPSDTFKSSGCAERSVCYGAKQHTRSGPGYEDDLWGVLRARNPSYQIMLITQQKQLYRTPCAAEWWRIYKSYTNMWLWKCAHKDTICCSF